MRGRATAPPADAASAPAGPGRSCVWRAVAGILVLAGLAGCSSRTGNPARVATGYISHVVCSNVFVSGLAPARVSDEDIAANPAFRGVHWALRHDVHRETREVTARALGGFAARAVYREGVGCLTTTAGATPAAAVEVDAGGTTAPRLPDIAGGDVVAPANRALAAAVDAAFAESPDQAPRRVHAIVIVHGGRVVAERYASGFGVDTAVHGWSATKSVTNALLGILVRQGRLAMHAPAPVPAWAAPDDPRHAITPDHLLRMQSGLDLGDSLTARLSSGWDVSNRMTFTEPDMAGFAERAALIATPGTTWRYADASATILGRIVRDGAGGGAVDVLRFARRELFGPLGIRRATLELDATGTPIASTFMFATPREWARVGLLYLDDGVVGGTRILPEGWVRESTRETPGAWVGYGAGWWINHGDSAGARFRRGHGMPADAFMALGNYGQAVVVVPSAKLVVARFATTYDVRQAMLDLCRLIAATVAALP